MHYQNYRQLLTRLSAEQKRGPFALLLVQDDLDLEATLAACQQAGLPHIIALGPKPLLPQSGALTAPFNTHAPGAYAAALNGLIEAAPDAWILPLWNGQRLIWPYGATRRLSDLFGFLAEERRRVLGGVELDLYPGPDGGWAADRLGYRQDGEGAIYGGLRRRIGAPCPAAARRIDGPLAIRATPGLKMEEDGRLNDPELNALHCPWHHNPTAARLSLRVWAWLRAQADERLVGFPCHWHGSASGAALGPQGLRDAGLIEPGQWV